MDGYAKCIASIQWTNYLGIKRKQLIDLCNTNDLGRDKQFKGLNYSAFLSFSYDKYQESNLKILLDSKNIHHNYELKNQGSDLMVCLYNSLDPL